MVNQLRLVCDICGKHFYYNVYAKGEYKEAEKKYFEHYKVEHGIELS